MPNPDTLSEAADIKSRDPIIEISRAIAAIRHVKERFDTDMEAAQRRLFDAERAYRDKLGGSDPCQKEPNP